MRIEAPPPKRETPPRSGDGAKFGSGINSSTELTKRLKFLNQLLDRRAAARERSDRSGNIINFPLDRRRLRQGGDA